MKKFGLFAGIFLSLLVICSFTVGAVAVDEVIIGVFEPMTGPMAGGGQMSNEGKYLALEQTPTVLGIPIMGTTATNPLVTLGKPYSFRVCFIDPFQGAVMANFAVNNLKAKTAVIIQDIASDFSVGLSNYFREAFIKLTG